MMLRGALRRRTPALREVAAAAAVAEAAEMGREAAAAEPVQPQPRISNALAVFPAGTQRPLLHKRYLLRPYLSFGYSIGRRRHRAWPLALRSPPPP